jgi:phospholipid/cholesterol/gamma-HCH transport system ATP-binding protein
LSQPRIEIRGLRLAFGAQVVLDGIDLDVHERENLVLMGTSGSGKTVLLRCILGLLEPDMGSIRIDGQETTDLSERARNALLLKTGVLFQRNALFDSLTAWENVAFGLIEPRRMPRGRAKEVALSKLAEVGLDADTAELLPAELSGGMQKRVALARALAADPEFLFLDNPVAGLDPVLTHGIDHLIAERVSALGATAISITQDADSVRRIADRVAMLWQGRIVWTGLAAAIDNSGNPFVDQLVHGRIEGPIGPEG